jgi:beta-glucosidase
MKGDEIVQLYIRDEFSSATRPVKELKGFQRISLDASETKMVTFPIEKSLLAFWDINMNYLVEPGTFQNHDWYFITSIC